VELTLISQPALRLPRPGRRAGSSKAQAVLSASCQHFASFGYLGTRLEDIAAAAQVTRATIYAHYKSKENLFAECLTALFNELPRPAEVIGTQGGDVRESLTCTARRLLGAALSPPSLGIYRMLIAPHPTIVGLTGKFWTESVDPHRRAFQDALHHWMSEGLLSIECPARATGHYFSLVLNDPTLKWLTSTNESIALFDLDAHAEDAVSAFLAAYRTTRS